MTTNYHNWIHDEPDYYNWAGEPVYITQEWVYQTLSQVLGYGFTAFVVLLLAAMISGYFYRPKLTKKQKLAVARILEAERLKEAKLK